MKTIKADISEWTDITFDSLAKLVDAVRPMVQVIIMSTAQRDTLFMTSLGCFDYFRGIPLEVKNENN